MKRSVLAILTVLTIGISTPQPGFAQGAPQVAACRAEGARLSARLWACGDDLQCRDKVQAAIIEFNVRCANRMTREQIAEAQRLSAEWKPVSEE